MNYFFWMVWFLISFSAVADTCDDFLYTEGLSIEQVGDGLKIVSTASVSVSYDDVDTLQDARKEAALAAKAEISKFFGEKIHIDEQIIKTIEESKLLNSSGKSADRNEVIKRIKTLQNSSSSLLKGVQNLGDCYTPDTEVRVSVGLKPETIKSSVAGKRQMGNSENSEFSLESPESSMNDSYKTPHKPIDGYSNTERLDGF